MSKGKAITNIVFSLVFFPMFTWMAYYGIIDIIKHGSSTISVLGACLLIISVFGYIQTIRDFHYSITYFMVSGKQDKPKAYQDKTHR